MPDIEPKRPTPAWRIAIAMTLVVAWALSAHSGVRATAMSIRMRSPESPPVTLTLECVDSATIRFEITNVGSTDAALPLGSALANGRKYLVSGLHLRMKPWNGNVWGITDLGSGQQKRGSSRT